MERNYQGKMTSREAQDAVIQGLSGSLSGPLVQQFVFVPNITLDASPVTGQRTEFKFLFWFLHCWSNTCGLQIRSNVLHLPSYSDSLPASVHKRLKQTQLWDVFTSLSFGFTSFEAYWALQTTPLTLAFSFSQQVRFLCLCPR